MYTGTRTYASADTLPSRKATAKIAEPVRRRTPTSYGHGLAGLDLENLWDKSLFLKSPLDYSRNFMKRMHHPFHEVLACLYLNADNAAVAYNRFFRGERSTALAHIPTIVRSAGQLNVPRVVLAHNPICSTDTRLPDLSLVCRQLQATGIELFDFLLIHSDRTLSMRAHDGL